MTTWCWDAFITAPLPAGSYQVVLTESENTPLGPYLTDPFVYDDAGNFTAPPGITAPGFWNLSLDRRNNSYAVDIGGVDSAELPLVTGIGALVNSASWKNGPFGPNTILTLFFRGLPSAAPLRAF